MTPTGGGVINPVKVGLFQTVAEPEKPTKDGYSFIEWQLDGEKYDFNTPITKNITLKAIWKFNGVEVSNEESLISAIEKGGNIKLLDNFEISNIINVDKNVSLDMNGKTITLRCSTIFNIIGNANITILGNGKINGLTGQEAAEYDSKAIIQISGKDAKLTILNGTITAGGKDDCGLYGIYASNGGNVILGSEQDGTGPIIESWFAALGENNTTSPANFTIYGGKYTCLVTPSDSNWWSYFCAPIYAASSGNINIYGGEFNGYYAISSRYKKVDQKINIYGGKFNGSKSALFIDTKDGSTTGDREISILGGTFTTNPSAYLADDYIVSLNEDNDFVVSKTNKTSENTRPAKSEEINAFNMVFNALSEVTPASSLENTTYFDKKNLFTFNNQTITVNNSHTVKLNGNYSGSQHSDGYLSFFFDFRKESIIIGDAEYKGYVLINIKPSGSIDPKVFNLGNDFLTIPQP